MENLPVYIGLIMGVSVCLTFIIFIKATKAATTFIMLATLWLVVQGLVSLNGFYTVTNTLPPRMALLIGPPLLLIVSLFTLPKYRQYVDSLDVKWLTLLHVVRVPVEMVLYWLFVHKAVPGLMTFEGINFDILAGLTAPLVFYFGFIRRKLSNQILIAWNLSCLGLVVNIIFHGIFSVASPFQQFGFEQPNVGLLYFPYTLLPGFIVPIVLLSHFVAIRQLLLTKAGAKVAAPEALEVMH